MSTPDKEEALELARSMTGIRTKEGAPIPVYSSELKELGSANGVGIELFFRTMRGGMWWFGAASLVGGLIAVLNSLHHQHTMPSLLHSELSTLTLGRWEDWCVGGYPSPTGGCELGLYAQVLLWQVITVMWIGFLYYLRATQIKTSRLTDERNVTAGDFAIEVRGIPRSGRSGPELFAFFSQFGKVHSVALGYECAEYVAATEELEEAEIGLKEAQTAGEKVTEADGKLRAAQAKLEKLEKKTRKPTSVAYVTFEKSDSRDLALNRLKGSGYRLWDYIGRRELPKYKGTRLDVIAAPEPSDVWWENLEISAEAVRLRSILTLCVTLALLGITVGTLVSIKHWKDKKLDDYHARIDEQTAKQHEEDAQWLFKLSLAFAAVVAGVIGVVNVAMKLAVQKLTYFERQNTRTGYEESIFFKLSLAYILNQSLLIIFVEPVREQWFDAGNVMNQALFIMVLNPLFLEPIKLLPPENVLNRYILGRFAHTQHRLNKLYQPPYATIGEYFAGIMKTFALGIIYGPAMPVSYAVSVFSLAIAYFANKYSLLRIFRPPPLLREQIIEAFEWLLSWIVFASIVVQYNLVGSNRDGGGANALAGWMVTVSLFAFLAYLFVPVHKIFPRFNEYVEVDDADETKGQTFSSIDGLARYECPIDKPTTVADVPVDSKGQVVRIDEQKTQTACCTIM